jgi:hypothetical protein
MDKQGIEGGGLLSQDPGCVGIDGKAQAGLFFCLVNGRVGAGIEDDRGFHSPDGVPDGLLAGEITFIPAGQNHVLAGVV